MLRQFACALIATSVALATVPVVPGTAWAQDVVGEKVQKLSKEGTELYRAGNYEEAARKFEAAYELEPVENLLFNAAKCYEKLEEWDKAIELYKQFTVAPGVDPKAKEVALQQVEKLEEISEVEKRTAEKEKSDSDSQNAQTDKQAPPPVAPEPDYTWSYVALGSGVALLATGGVFGVLASSEQSNFDVAETAEERRAARDTGTTYALTADIMYGLGAAAAITGVILFVTADADESEAGVTVAPVVGKDGVGVGLSGRF